MSDPQLLAEASNPATPAARLAELVVQDPSVGAIVARHPNVYPGLLEWLASNGDPAAQREASAVLQGSAGGPPPRLPAGPAQSEVAQGGYAQPAVNEVAQGGAAANQPFGAQQQPGAGEASDGLNWHPGTDDAPRKRRRWVLVTAIVLVVALAAGGGAWWWFGLRGSVGSNGQATPQAAAEGLIESFSDKDLVKVIGTIAPSEANVLTPITQQLESAEGDADASRAAKLAMEALDLVEVTTEGIESTTGDLDGGAGEVSATAFTAGTVTVNTSDEQQLAEKLAEIEQIVDPSGADSADEIRDGFDFPQTGDFADFSSDKGYDFTIVTVKDGDLWYASPMLTTAENAFLAAQQYDSSLRRGTVVSADQATGSGSPEDALKASAEAIVEATDSGDYSAIAKTLPTAERRLVSLYGDLLFENLGGGSGVTLEAQGATAQTDGAKSKVLPDDYVFSFGSGYGAYELTWSQLEFTLESTSSYSSYGSSTSIDVTDSSAASELGIDQLALVAVQENGAWYFSPLATLADIAQVVVPKLAALEKSGRLDSVLEQYSEDLENQVSGY